MIIDAYCKIRTIDNTIPDDVLDFMKDAAIEKLSQIIKESYLVSDVIFVEIKNGKITDKRGTEISTEFILQHEHYLGKGWGYVII